MRKIFFLIFTIVFTINLSAAKIENPTDSAVTNENVNTQEESKLVMLEPTPEVKAKIDNYLLEIGKINDLLEDDILLKRYSNYIAYRSISKELHSLKDELTDVNKKNRDLLYKVENKIRIKKNELELISEYKDSPIGKLIDPPEIEKYEPITNPFGIINALSYKKKMKDHKKEFNRIIDDVSRLITLLDEKMLLYLDLYNLDPKDEYEKKINFLDSEKKDFNMVLEILSTTSEVYTRKIEQVVLETDNQISEQISKSFIIFSIIAVVFIFSFLVKLALKKYFSQNENFYMANKVINFILVLLIVLIVLFSYIDNVSYVITILGFASAGIAIALKDWFMSIFGWMVIVTSGSIQVGDRIKVTRGGVEAVGDVLDISLFKITIREDITLTSYKVNRRTGRIFFIPNNYVFSEMIANYTHSGLRTVWDGIDITITFDSNYKKAQHIAKEILKHYSKGYTDITRKQLSKMRNKYNLRATGVEPRVYTFVEPYGIVISSWYLTNSYAALVLRSTMSPEILQAFMAEDDITIAYPTQQINLGSNQAERVPPADLPEAP
ncbi:MscS Mechanosensitive ion channel [Arcobacter nitrofigilis DSM 7299]|uniref:MscS Mechanosensitive ion channel n=1 Tax=Arcobacter nitrofigilis (strain ATCC 33309 / DSM 7299 / CCUG 15893 / LMG 7604 / NCTC 12251 / CI) TaxID=572480 RepID=D5V640_ARCNC|nr:mechanosensitive ion channel domain-containing protein [Arcobacter nitrofigilis]ADG93207.1 MscS Mechanosensitive ion channel [Arcobacter nitrofigilis DSM 7299]